MDEELQTAVASEVVLHAAVDGTRLLRLERSELERERLLVLQLALP